MILQGSVKWSICQIYNVDSTCSLFSQLLIPGFKKQIEMDLRYFLTAIFLGLNLFTRGNSKINRDGLKLGQKTS